MNIEFLEAVVWDGLFAAVAAIGFFRYFQSSPKSDYVSALLAAVGHSLRFS